MKVSTVGCTSLRPNQSFKSRRQDENNNQAESVNESSSENDKKSEKMSVTVHKRSATKVAKNVGAAVILGATGALASKCIASKLLKRISADSKLADALGKQAFNAVDSISKKVNDYVVPEGAKTKSKVKSILSFALEKLNKLADKSVNYNKLATELKDNPNEKLLKQATDLAEEKFGMLEIRQNLINELKSKFPNSKQEDLEVEAQEMIKSKFPNELKDMNKFIDTTYNELAANVVKGKNIVNNTLSVAAGIGAGGEALKDKDGDGERNITEATKKLTNLASDIVVAATT